ncbi:DUF6520 family protein [Pinibacter aurantiacus]|uniref:Uncharacterized protein n=1 Tax=Pinibacter aurantiacus TaxID=2851599 RepID=A0A9E2S818_9BACT|nr:hypothetical protein [Pinibacter aurantiacus]MBV4357327.1 hypothetical protein [Pinibacter aurantiacus]
MKQYLLGFVALVTAITLNSFTLRTENHRGTTNIYKYLDYPNDAFINNSAHYQQVSSITCPGGSHRCAVEAQDDGTGLPDLTVPYTPRTKN